MGAVCQFATADGAKVPYVEVGSPAGKPLMVIPGLSDGLKPLRGRGSAWMLHRFYKTFDHHRTIVSSRRTVHHDGFSIEDMAADVAELIGSFGPGPVDVLGVSMGGMIAQTLAIEYPELVDHLILGLTVPYVDEHLRGVVEHWQRLAEAGR